mgnify:CR=1 FL=1
MNTFTVEELFKKGFHYGHKITCTNTKMKPYIFDTRWGISIIDLTKTTVLFNSALKLLDEIIKKNGKVLFVGTKNQAKSLIKKTATECGEFYVNQRWLGGTITNNHFTIGVMSSQLKKIQLNEESGFVLNFAKKEQLELNRKKTKLLNLIEGIKELKGEPDLLIVIDAQKEKNAILEANKRKIPVIALTDTDTSFPDMISNIVPGNDEGALCIEFFLEQCAATILAAKASIPVVEKKEKVIIKKD